MAERAKASASRGDREIGLPVMLSVAGLLAAGIIAAAAGLESWVGDADQMEPVAVVGPETGTAGLRQERTLIDLQSTVRTLEIKVEQLTADNDRLARQVRGMEEQFGSITASIPQRSTTDIDHRVAGDRKADRVSVQYRKERPEPERTLARDAEEPAPKAAAPGDRASDAGPVRTTQTYFALQLPTFRTVADLGKAWQGIRRRSGKVLDGLEPRAYAVRDDQIGVVYRLLAGPIRNAGDAAVRCVRLGEIGIPCETTVFAGERLATTATN